MLTVFGKIAHEWLHGDSGGRGTVSSIYRRENTLTSRYNTWQRAPEVLFPGDKATCHHTESLSVSSLRGVRTS